VVGTVRRRPRDADGVRLAVWCRHRAVDSAASDAADGSGGPAAGPRSGGPPCVRCGAGLTGTALV